MARHERFLAWQRAHQLTLLVYRLSGAWPATERYGLTAQTRRAAASVAANIAEGAARAGSREFRRFLNIALGSLGELDYHLRLARDLGMLEEGDWKPLLELGNEVGRLSMGLKRSLDRSC
jgi:four helix bundle protein